MVDTIIFAIYQLIITLVVPLLGIFVLGRVAWKFWVHYIQQDFISGIEYVTLEIIPPREVLRSPKAMELFISNALYHQSGKGGREEFWQGAVHFWFSLEIASIEGQVHFFIHIPSRIKSLVETQMYAQYPQAQVREVDDYTLAVDEISPRSKWMGWGCEFKLEKASAYPIKTYVDFGLDKDPKEEVKIDPLSPLIEFFGSLGKGEQAWMQIIITPSHVYSTWKKHDWVKEAQDELFRLLGPFTSHKEVKEVHEVGVGRSRIETRVPAHLDDVVKKMRAKSSKIAFETGIRVMYVAKKENWSLNTRRNIRLIFRQFASPDSNQLVRYNSTQGDAFNSQFFGLSEKKVMILANRMLHEYQERGGFFYHMMRHRLFNEHNLPGILKIIVKQFFLPYFHSEAFVLNTEELATLWHFPGQILKVPSLTRIESKEAAPPPNLPM